MQKQIIELTNALLQANYQELERAFVLSDLKLLFTPEGDGFRSIDPASFAPATVEINQSHPAHNFPEIGIFPKFNGPSLEIRTNGHVAFLAHSDWFHQKGKVKKYKAVYRTRDGDIHVVDQGAAILESMPESISTLYRMSPEEVPVTLNIPRSVLVELYEKGALEINTLEFFEPGAPVARTTIGLEFGLSFVGEDAANILKLYL